MWILSKNEENVINSNQISCFHILGSDMGYSSYLLCAGKYSIGEFGTKDDALKELKHIYDALIAGQESYSVG